jgi:hypothetical protein
MFKKSEIKQPSLFEGVEMHLNKKGQKLISDPKSWFNVFRDQVLSRIDETTFSCLYSDEMGRPNASIRTLLGMIILKSGLNITDEQLFSSCELDLGMRKALGLHNLNDELPSPATYYEFKKKIFEYQEQSSVNLIDTVFHQITAEQVKEFQVNGKTIRMDSKLIQSNIARCSRLGLVIKTLQHFLNNLEAGMISSLDKKWKNIAEKMIASSSDNQQYGMSELAKQEKLVELGRMIKAILDNRIMKKAKHYSLLERLFNDQYYIDTKGKVMIKESSEVSADSLQSPHDPDASYRKKSNDDHTGKPTVNGYSANITETCNHTKDNPRLDLIVSAQVESAVIQDGEFMYKGIKDAENATGTTPEMIITDGGYSNNEEEKKVKEEFNELTHIKTGLSGRTSDMEYEMDENNELKYVIQRGVRKKAIEVQRRDGTTGYKIKDKKQPSGFRYIYQDQIENHKKREALENLPKEIRNLRPPIESTIHQVFCGMEGNKSRFRRLARVQIGVFASCIWANFKRIGDKICKKGKWKAFFYEIFISIQNDIAYRVLGIEILLSYFSVVVAYSESYELKNHRNLTL